MTVPARRVVGVSLKMYLGYARTLDWTRAVVAAASSRRADVELFVLPSFPALPAVGAIVAGTGISVGAQDLSASDAGAQTGEVGGALLAELGCSYVEVGHAERRGLFGESDATVAAKTAAALRHGLTPVLCVGEADRLGVADAVRECVRQIDAALAEVPTDPPAARLVVAYEPHWAIGATEPAPDEHIAGVCDGLRSAVRGLAAHPGSVVIYGGSAGPGLLTRIGGHVDGLFLGRFAHDPAALAAVLDEAAAPAGRPTEAASRRG